MAAVGDVSVKLPLSESSQELAGSWRRLTRAATVVARMGHVDVP